ncbi:MAG: FAA hydrolase family protein [Bacteroidetes bacterium]|nr:MAG: FAA hydrolase family protein [Bacteroidota bacterium]
MKLIRFGEAGHEKPGILTEAGKRLDVSAFGEDFDERFFQNDGLSRLETWLAGHQASLPEVSDTLRLGPPLGRPSKLICIGLNYADHARESGAQPPKEPIIFFKSTTAICGPADDLILPRGSVKTDWEVELAIVIGKKATYVPEHDALDYVAGYLLHNDYSEREFQLERGGQWVKGKSCDTFAPLGPFLATRDEIADPQELAMWLRVNGETVQQSRTSEMIFGVAYLVSYLSQFMTLLPGDIISTGTPHGVGLGMKPPRYLSAGDRVEWGIEGLGETSHFVKPSI